MLQPIMRNGQILEDAIEPLDQAVDRAQADIASLPAPLRELSPAAPFSVEISPYLRQLQADTLASIVEGHRTVEGH